MAPAGQRRRRRRAPTKSHPTRVSEVVCLRDTALCEVDLTLLDAVDTLVSSGRTAAVLVDKRAGGAVRGILTENDILQALLEGVTHETPIEQWLRGSEARLPGFMMPALTLPPSATLAEAAACMTAMALDQEEHDFSFACHHLLVKRGQAVPAGEAAGSAQASEEEANLRLLSALDVALGMISAAAKESAGRDEGGASTATNLTVAQVMKPRTVVPACYESDRLLEALQALRYAKQNCALVVAVAPRTAAVSSAIDLDLEPDEADQQAAPVADQSQQTGSAVDVEAEVKTEMDVEPAEPEEQAPKPDPDIRGVITTSDALRAYSEHPGRIEEVTLGGWLHGIADSPTRRDIWEDASMADAADKMKELGVHHLLVTKAGTDQVVGVISALDIVCAIGQFYMRDPSEPVLEQRQWPSAQLADDGD